MNNNNGGSSSNPHPLFLSNNISIKRERRDNDEQPLRHEPPQQILAATRIERLETDHNAAISATEAARDNVAKRLAGSKRRLESNKAACLESIRKKIHSTKNKVESGKFDAQRVLTDLIKVCDDELLNLEFLKDSLAELVDVKLQEAIQTQQRLKSGLLKSQFKLNKLITSTSQSKISLYNYREQALYFDDSPFK
jgi:hypothetical protein